MPVIVWLSKLVASPIFEKVLVPSVAKFLSDFFEGHAKKAEAKSARAQAVAAAKIADNAKRAEALRDASKRLSDITRGR